MNLNVKFVFNAFFLSLMEPVVSVDHNQPIMQLLCGKFMIAGATEFDDININQLIHVSIMM